MGSTKALATAPWGSIAIVTLTAALGIASIAAGFQGWAWLKTTALERALLIVAGFALVYPSAWTDLGGLAMVVVAVASQWWRLKQTAQPV
jgi:TRAP-type uncharacterized transport system fused permease subunit